MTALAGFVIVELAHRVAGEFAAKLFADLGAEVVKVEPPAGSPTRVMGPFVDGASTVFLYLNTNKKSVVLDLATEGGRELLERLLARADVLVTDHDEAWARAHRLGPDELTQRHPSLVHCAISPFGQGAPPAWQQARPLNVIHASGWGYHTPSESDPTRPPLKGPGRFLSDYEAGLEAALAIGASLYRKRQSGRGQFIDIAEVEALISRTDCVLGRMLAGEQEPGPERTRFDMGGPGAPFACADGYVFLLMTARKHWLGLRELMGEPDWATPFPDDWLEFHCTPDRVEEFRRNFRAWIANQPKVAVSEAAQKLGVPLVPVNAATDLHHNPQYAHRGYFQELDGLLYPTVPYRFSASPAELKTPAPALGADHQDLVR